MSPETAKWYLERVDAYLLTPELAQEKYQLSPELFLEILKRGFGVASFAQAKALLEEITQGLFTQNIPDEETLKYWQEELEKSQEQKNQITEKVAKEIEAKISLAKKYRNILQENVKELAVEPDTAGKAAWQLTETLAAQIDEEPTKSTLEEHSQFLTASLPLMLEKYDCVVPQTSLTNIVQQLLKNTSQETTSLIKVKAEAVTTPEIEHQTEETLFTPKVKEKMAEEEEGVASVYVYTLLNPPVAASFAKKVGLAPVVKTLQFIDIVAGEELGGNAVKEWREILHKGLNSQDLTESINALKEAGVSPEHPQIKALTAKREKIQNWEQAHPRTSTILRHYHEFTKKTSRRQIYSEEIKTSLARLSPRPAWFNKLGKQTYSLKLKRTLDSIGTRFFFYEKTTLPSGKTLIHFALPDKFVRFFSAGRAQSFQAIKSWVSRKVISPVLTRLGKTALGQTIKKSAVWLLTRLGLAAIPTGVTQVVAAALFIKDLIPLVKTLFRKLKDNPILLILGGVTALVIPLLTAIAPILMPILLIAGGISLVGGLLLGAKAWLGGAISSIGGFFTTAAHTIGGALSALGTISLPAALPALGAVGAVGLVGTLTVITTMKTTSSMVEKPGRGDENINYGEPVNPRPPDPSVHLAEQVVYVLQSCGINYVTQSTWAQTNECLSKSTLLGKDKIITQFSYSVNAFFYLQCVGFVRGVMDALGKDPGSLGKDGANDYLDPPYPSNYYPPNTNMQEVDVGDLAIMRGSTWGHIAIVVSREAREGTVFIRTAEALGNSGLVRVVESQAYLFDGFLRPK